MKNITVFCASSSQAAPVYVSQAHRLGEILAEHNLHCYYGGGRVGLMGALAETMVKVQGQISGIIPQFMVDEGWDNPDVEEIVVPDMQIRKQMLLNRADAIVALPGGCGTLEELIEAITSRQLGLIKVPIIIVNVNGFFDHFIEMLHTAIEQRFMRPEHASLWTAVSSADEVMPAIESAPEIHDARGIAAM